MIDNLFKFKKIVEELGVCLIQIGGEIEIVEEFVNKFIEYLEVWGKVVDKFWE